MTGARSAALLLLGAAALRGGDHEAQQALDITLAGRGKLGAILHSRFREGQARLGFYQFRLGPVFQARLHPRFAALGGYYFSRQQRSDPDLNPGGEGAGWSTTHRVFGGGEWLVLDRGGRWETRGVYERFLRDLPDFFRYRQRFRWTYPAARGPYAGAEVFWDAAGWRSTRWSAGWRWTLGSRAGLDAGYFWEPRRGEFGPARHMWLVTVHLREIGRRRDPDL